MSRKNVIKTYTTNSYYHIYNRGVNKRKIFIDDEDAQVFFNLIKRYLCGVVEKDRFNRIYDNYSDQLELNAFCLMPNHFHFLVYQKHNPEAITELMRRIAVSYSKYFNAKYSRVGHLFESNYKAVLIDSHSQLLNISKYIHRNPKDLPGVDFRTYEYSSCQHYYSDQLPPSWLRPVRIQDLFRTAKLYRSYVEAKN